MCRPDPNNRAAKPKQASGLPIVESGAKGPHWVELSRLMPRSSDAEVTGDRFWRWPVLGASGPEVK
jgi:hypothetical protein